MNTVLQLEQRLQDIARVLEAHPEGLALLGLGSVGVETQRLDQWSDLDFFAIVQKGAKARWLGDTAWLAQAHPVSYIFQNTADGFKLLFKDGIFAEMAIFEPQELAAIPFSPGRVIWSRAGFDTACLTPVSTAGTLEKPASREYVLGELITCLYVGLCRYRRGETLSAWRFIQGYCLDRVLELAELTLDPAPVPPDAYNRDRRFESRYPSWTPVLDGLLRGYHAIPQSAVFLVEWADETFGINQAMKARILELAGE